MELEYYKHKYAVMTGEATQYIDTWEQLLDDMSELAWITSMVRDPEEADKIMTGLDTITQELMEDRPELFI